MIYQPNEDQAYTQGQEKERSKQRAVYVIVTNSEKLSAGLAVHIIVMCHKWP